MTDLVVTDGRVTHVVTDHGTIEAESVVLACGMYTPDVAALAGVNVPIVPMAHQYLITKAVDGVTPDLPQLRDPDNLVYFRREGDGLLLGGYERDPAPWSLHGVPADFNNRLLPEDWDRFAPLMQNACRRVPAAETADVVSLVNGPEGFTPDNEFVLGESDVHGLFVAAGFCAHGIAGAGGVGRVMAEWIARRPPVVRHVEDGHPPLRRAVPQPRVRACARRRGVLDLLRHPLSRTRSAPRPGRSAAPPRIRGWSSSDASSARRAAGSARTGSARTRRAGDATTRPRGWAGEHWSAAIGAEALACRDAVVLFDETSFSKIEVAGPGAAAFLDGLCANEIDRPVGTVTYTQCCNESGGVECDLTVTRLGDTRFLLVTGTAFGSHDLGWITTQLERQPLGDAVDARDVTSAWACYGVWGPRARAVLASLTDADLGNDAFPYMTARRISIGAVPGDRGAGDLRRRARLGAVLPDRVRVDAVGRALGRRRRARHRRRRLPRDRRAARREGLPRVGRRRDPRRQPVRSRPRLRGPARQGRAVRRPRRVARGEGRGHQRADCARSSSPTRSVVALGSEPVRIDGEIVGRVTSGGYGFRVAQSIAYAYVPAERSEPGRTVEVEVFGEWIRGEIVRDPLYDPTGARIRS